MGTVLCGRLASRSSVSSSPSISPLAGLEHVNEVTDTVKCKSPKTRCDTYLPVRTGEVMPRPCRVLSSLGVVSVRRLRVLTSHIKQ